jgi:hypothetical protein
MQDKNPEIISDLLEFGEADAWTNFYLSSPPAFVTEFKLSVEQIDSIWTTMIPKLDWSFFNRIVGLGIRHPATEAELDQAIEVFKDTGCKNYMAQISPFAKPTQISKWLERRGFKRGRNWAKVYRGNEPPIQVPTGLRVEAIGSEHADDFAEVALAAFEMPLELRPMLKGNIEKTGWHHYLAFDGKQPVSAGAMYVSGEVAWLGFGSTLASHRKRGGQGAIFAHRIQDGLKLGCKWFVTETGEETPEAPNPSYHNMIRHGFKLAYMRPNYVYQEASG